MGLRKIISSYRIDLFKQFLTESLLFSFLSFALGLLLARALLPYFNMQADKSLFFPWKAWWLGSMLLLSTSAVGILAGIYPFFYLSSFNPIQVLKGQLSKGTRNAGLRSILVVFQFTTSNPSHHRDDRLVAKSIKLVEEYWYQLILSVISVTKLFTALWISVIRAFIHPQPSNLRK